MRTYSARDVEDDINHVGWVPADVAQRLYDIVAALVEHGAWYPSAIELDHAIGCGPGGDDLESDAIAALAAADGEEV